MRKTAKTTSRFLRRFWRGLREWCGDAAYESYLRSKGTQSGSGRTLTRPSSTWNSLISVIPAPTAAAETLFLPLRPNPYRQVSDWTS